MLILQSRAIVSLVVPREIDGLCRICGMKGISCRAALSDKGPAARTPAPQEPHMTRCAHSCQGLGASCSPSVGPSTRISCLGDSFPAFLWRGKR